MKKILLWVAVSFVFILPVRVSASGAEFSATPIVNEYQADQGAPYFALRMPAGGQTDLVVEIQNISNQVDTYTVMVNSAVTNSQPAINYAKSPLKSDLSVPETLQFSRIAKLADKTIKVNPNGTARFSVHISLPDTAFSGKILGGITVTRAVRANEKSSNALTNQFAYAIPIVIRESDNPVSPNITAEAPKVDANPRSGQISIPMHNLAPAIVNGVTLETIIKNDAGKVVFSRTDKSRTIAPQSNFNYVVNFGKQTLPAGKYSYSLVVKDDASHKWQWSKSFTISAKISDKIKKHVADAQPKKPVNLLAIIVGAMAIVIIGLLAVVWKLLSNRNK